MMKYYVIADPHGFYDETVSALSEKGFFEDGAEKKLVVCGDLLDRGGSALKLVDFMIDLKNRGELIYIQGNHEDLFMQALHEIVRGNVFTIASGMSHHYSNGTWDTMLQLASMTEREAVSEPNELVRRVRKSAFYDELLPSARDFYETENYVFCHGWIPTFVEGYRLNERYTFNPNWREASPEEWKRARWFNGMELCCKHGIRIPDKVTICGHWHTSYGHSKIEKVSPEWGEGADFSPFVDLGIIALDACTAYSKRVNCIVLDEGEA